MVGEDVIILGEKTVVKTVVVDVAEKDQKEVVAVKVVPGREVRVMTVVGADLAVEVAVAVILLTVEEVRADRLVVVVVIVDLVLVVDLEARTETVIVKRGLVNVVAVEVDPEVGVGVFHLEARLVQEEKRDIARRENLIKSPRRVEETENLAVMKERMPMWTF